MHSRTKSIHLAVCALLAADFVPASSLAGSNEFSLGLEGFYDNYQEPDATVDSRAYYGSVTGSYAHDWNAFFAALDGRASYGRDDYSSSQGNINGVPQWEFELRQRVGYTFTGKNSAFSPYIGLGERDYRDEGKGYGIAQSGGEIGAYDRNIFQVYLPVGATYAYHLPSGLTISPNLEYDQFLWGKVDTHLGEVPGGVYNGNTVQNVDLDTKQDTGWGARGSIMLGKSEDGWGWQAGPFIRYWDIQGSNSATGEIVTNNTTHVTQNVPFYEPHNTRLQAGLQARILW